ncbi:transcription termination/antitermination protein NusG [Candidatus Poriferisocius sp.]|uniref:transcription termination/antitermination protein NusG n=1 Tax=Candidatus Poriferisocius sp. TaxID=3101276 RepID=UPI003B018DB1
MNPEVDETAMTDLFPTTDTAEPESEATDPIKAGDAEADAPPVDAAEAAAALLPTGPVAEPDVEIADIEGAALLEDKAMAEHPVEVIDAEELVYEKDEDQTESISPFDMPGKWYVVHTQSGYENKVQQNIEARRKTMDMESHIHETVIPMEDVVEFKGGKKVTTKKKMFPGYLLVRAEMNDVSWDVIRNTPGVTGFVGHGRRGSKPSALKRKDVENFLQVKTDGEQTVRRTKPRLLYEVGETIRVKEGPFADFSGEVAEINEDQLKMKVLVNIFGRETPVELEFSQVAKL